MLLTLTIFILIFCNPFISYIYSKVLLLSVNFPLLTCLIDRSREEISALSDKSYDNCDKYCNYLVKIAQSLARIAQDNYNIITIIACFPAIFIIAVKIMKIAVKIMRIALIAR